MEGALAPVAGGLGREDLGRGVQGRPCRRLATMLLLLVVAQLQQRQTVGHVIEVQQQVLLVGAATDTAAHSKVLVAAGGGVQAIEAHLLVGRPVELEQTVTRRAGLVVERRGRRIDDAELGLHAEQRGRWTCKSRAASDRTEQRIERQRPSTLRNAKD